MSAPATNTPGILLAKMTARVASSASTSSQTAWSSGYRSLSSVFIGGLLKNTVVTAPARSSRKNRYSAIVFGSRLLPFGRNRPCGRFLRPCFCRLCRRSCRILRGSGKLEYLGSSVVKQRRFSVRLQVEGIDLAQTFFMQDQRVVRTPDTFAN